MLLFSACPELVWRAERACPEPHSGGRDYSDPRAKSYEGEVMKSSYHGLPVPHDGEAIQFVGGKFRIPDRPIIPYIEGDGTGRDIWKASQRVFDAAVELVYGGKRKICRFVVFAGGKSV